MNDDLNIIDVPDGLENCPITCYFLETKNDLNNFADWIEKVDDDTLSMITDTGELIVYSGENDPHKDIPLNDDEESSVLDFMYLTMAVTSMEKNTFFSVYDIDKISNDENTTYMKYLYLFVVSEQMRRKGLITIEGSRKMTAHDTIFNPTTLGKKIAKELQNIP